MGSIRGDAGNVSNIQITDEGPADVDDSDHPCHNDFMSRYAVGLFTHDSDTDTELDEKAQAQVKATRSRPKAKPKPASAPQKRHRADSPLSGQKQAKPKTCASGDTSLKQFQTSELVLAEVCQMLTRLMRNDSAALVKEPQVKTLANKVSARLSPGLLGQFAEENAGDPHRHDVLDALRAPEAVLVQASDVVGSFHSASGSTSFPAPVLRQAFDNYEEQLGAFRSLKVNQGISLLVVATVSRDCRQASA